jgi:hypothetical protein
MIESVVCHISKYRGCCESYHCTQYMCMKNKFQELSCQAQFLTRYVSKIFCQVPKIVLEIEQMIFSKCGERKLNNIWRWVYQT